MGATGLNLGAPVGLSPSTGGYGAAAQPQIDLSMFAPPSGADAYASQASNYPGATPAASSPYGAAGFGETPQGNPFEFDLSALGAGTGTNATAGAAY